MKMSADHDLRNARSPSPEEAAILAEMGSPEIASPSSDDLQTIVTLYHQGRFTLALDQGADLLTRFPNSEILNNIVGAIHAGLGRYDQAIRHYDRAIALAPDYFEAYNNRGSALNDHRRPEEAVASFDAAIALNPDNPEAFNNRGIALRRLHRLDEALASASRAIDLAPACAEAYNNRGNTLVALGRGNEALADFDTAIALKPGYAQALINRGNALLAMKRPEDAIASYDAAIAAAPANVQAYNNRGTALRGLKRLDEALVSHERALKMAAGSTLASAEVRNLKAHMCLWDDNPFDTGMAQLGTGDEAFPPFYMLGFEDSPQRQLLCARNWTARQYGEARSAVFHPRSNDAKIRIGYFSADFHNHATMYLIARLIELHDRSRFEIHAFSYGLDVQDEMRSRLLDAADGFHQVAGLSDHAVAKLARDMDIDIAVDLKGHTQDTRLGIFAQRAAAVQVAYLGYPGTLGSDFIDYMIADAVTIPPEFQRFYSEKIAYLPNCYQPNDDRREIADRVFSRSELGLPETGFVFCCFNNSYKITRAELDIWARLLKQVDGSVLWLLQGNRWATDNLRREAAARGIAPERLVFAERMPLADHLARHRCADLFLDTFGINAHTTASDALWAGLPVITRLGNSFVARVAGSLLRALDMPELVTQSSSAYEQRALDIATDPAELARLKAKLAQHRLTRPLFDTAQYTRDIEALYERLLTGE